MSGYGRPALNLRRTLVINDWLPLEWRDWCLCQTPRHECVTPLPLRLLPIRVLVRIRIVRASRMRGQVVMSIKLTDAQLVMLSAAAQGEDLCLTSPDKNKGAVRTIDDLFRPSRIGNGGDRSNKGGVRRESTTPKSVTKVSGFVGASRSGSRARTIPRLVSALARI
jgi:hypothetical protein